MKRILSLGAVLAVLSTTTAQANPDTIWIPYPPGGIELGQGFDLLNNAKTSAVCVDFVTVEDAGLDTTYDIAHINSFSEVFSSMKISASGALQMAVLKASAKLGFANSVRTKTFGEKFSVTAQIRRGIFYTSPKLTTKPGARNILPAGQEASELKDKSAITFRTDMATDGAAFDFVTQCGHGFVSAISTGVELNAVVDTSKSGSEETSKFNGSLKLDALGGLITASGSIDGAADAKSTVERSYVTSFIQGGEGYTLPTTVAGLTEFLKNLPQLADTKPRPMTIAITPYSALQTGGGYAAFETAEKLRPVTYAFFAAREARDRLAHIVDTAAQARKGKQLVLANELDLHVQISLAYQSMRTLQDALLTCRQALETQNKNLSTRAAQTLPAAKINGAVDEGNQLGALYQSLVDTARTDASKREENAITALTAQTTLAGLDPVLQCIANEDVAAARATAMQAYLSSLVAAPIALDTLEDPLIPTATLHQNIAYLSKSDLGAKLPKLNELRKKQQSEYGSCVAQAKVTVASIGNSEGPIDVATPNPNKKLLTKLIELCDNNADELKTQITLLEKDIPANAEEDYGKSIQIVGDVLTRAIYRDQFYPLRNSLCGTDLNHELCTLSYGASLASLESLIQLDKDDYVRMADYLGLNEVTPPVDKVKSDNAKTPSRRPVYYENCGGNTGIYCK